MYRMREIERKDVEVINSWRMNQELISKLGAPFRYINREVDQRWYEDYLSSRSNTIRCSIVDNDDCLVGLVSLTNIDRNNQLAVFHIMIGENQRRGMGAGSFATSSILKHAFLDMNLNRVELSVLSSNNGAIKFYEKLGFKHEGIKRKALFKNGVFVDVVIMSVLKDEFLERIA